MDKFEINSKHKDFDFKVDLKKSTKQARAELCQAQAQLG